MFSKFRVPEGAIPVESLYCTISSAVDAQDSKIPKSLVIQTSFSGCTCSTTWATPQNPRTCSCNRSVLPTQTQFFCSFLGRKTKGSYGIRNRSDTEVCARRHHGYLICELTCLRVKLLLTQVMTNSYCESRNFYPEKQTRQNIGLHFSCQELYTQEQRHL